MIQLLDLKLELRFPNNFDWVSGVDIGATISILLTQLGPIGGSDSLSWESAMLSQHLAEFCNVLFLKRNLKSTASFPR